MNPDLTNGLGSAVSGRGAVIESGLTWLHQISSSWGELSSRTIPFVVLDVLLVAVLFYWAMMLIRETRAARMIYGLLLLAFLLLLGRLLDLTLLNWILRGLITTLLVAIPIVFQPELRAGLERLGRARFVGQFGVLKHPEIIQAIDDLVLAAEMLAKQKMGALMAIERQDTLQEYAQTGTSLQGKLSFELLMTIFYPKTPLHDGAVIVRGNMLEAASATLPIFQGSLDYNLGTRHKAALALAQQTDAIVVIVSEEKGTISLAYDRKIRFNLTPDELKRALLRLLKQDT